MQIKMLKIKDIAPYDKNPRRNGEAVKYVAESIKQFGFKNPIIIDKNGVIVAGHTRLKAAKQLKMTEVPCIVADDLTDEQVKAFRLADNKVSEKAEWDFDLLESELENIIDLDMEQFGFDLDELNMDFELEKELEQKKNQEETQRRVENILNLEYAQFKGSGKYDIPIIKPVYDLPEIKEWIGFNYVLSDEEPAGKAVHFFIDDYQFERVWSNPERYVDKLKRYVCVATPDFSPYGDMPLAAQIFNIYRKNWVGAFLQNNGITVIPTVRASTDERSLDFYIDGFPQKSIVLISNMWTKSETEKNVFLKEYQTMVERLRPKKIFVYGKQMNELTENIEYIKTFTAKRWYNNG